MKVKLVPLKATIGVVAVAALIAAVPLTGDYVTRQANVWQKDNVSKIMNNFVQTTCILSKLAMHQNVGKGPYRAKVNESTCIPGNAATPHDWWLNVVVEVVPNPDKNAPRGFIGKVWQLGEEVDGVYTPFANPVYAKYTSINGVSLTDKNGNFVLELCDPLASDASQCATKKYTFAKSNDFETHVTQNKGGGFGKYIHITGKVADDVGWGSILYHDYLNGQNTSSGLKSTDIDMNYAYSGSDVALEVASYVGGDPNATRQVILPAGRSCLDRSKANAKTTVYNYEVYNADGSIYDIQNPQIPYRIIDSNNQYIKDGSGNVISGRLMYDYANSANGWSLSVSPSVVRALLDQGQVLKAETWLGGVANYTLPIRKDPNDPTNFQILDSNGSPYQVGRDLRLTLHVSSGATVKGLLDSNLENTDQIVEYMGNGYLFNIGWDATNGDHYSIISGTEVTGTDDGKKYYIKPMFYSLEMSTKTLASCAPDAIAKLSNASVIRSNMPVSTQFSDSPYSTWVDPRNYMGAVPSVAGAFKYIDGVLQ